MSVSVLADWAPAHPYSVAVLAVLAGVLAYVVRRVRRASGRTPVAVVSAALGAVVCTAYSGDTSWNFARDSLHMASAGERSVMFAAAEIGLFSMALMARQNLRTAGAPGTPGVLVWVITGVQVIPAYSESGVVGGTVRAFVGPVLAGLLWHLAMGIELRHHTPGADSQSLPAILVRELRERLLARLGLSRRGRDAAQIGRDRWTTVATRRAARLADLETAKARGRRVVRARRRLAVAVDRTDAGVLPEQRAVLLDRIAAYRNASSLASLPLASPWQKAVLPPAPAPEPAPAAAGVERVPESEVRGYAYPRLARPVPEAVPAGVRLLPIVACGEAPQRPAVFAAEPPRTRHEVRAEYTPDPSGYTPHPAEYTPEPGEYTPNLSEYAASQVAAMMLADPDEPHDDSPPPPGEDTLTAAARGDFPDVAGGAVPSIRALKDRYGIGQQRAARIQSELKEVS